MRSARARLVGAALVPLLLAATACKFGSDDKEDDKKADNAAASTSAPASAPVAPSAAAPSAPASGNAGGNGKALTAAQLQTALLSGKELPSGWKTAAGKLPAATAQTVTPAGCQPVWDLIFGDPKKQPTAKAGATLTGPGGSYQVSLAEFAPGVAEKLFADTAGAVKNDTTTDCLAYSAKNAKGDITSVEGGTQDAPKLGDASLKLLVAYGPKASMDNPSNANPAGYVQFIRVGTAIAAVYVVSDVNVGMFPKDFPDDLVKTQVDKLTAAKKG
jgi:hypothetical protein